MKPKVHYQGAPKHSIDSDPGVFEENALYTDDPKKVTCRKCKALIPRFSLCCVCNKSFRTPNVPPEYGSYLCGPTCATSYHNNNADQKAREQKVLDTKAKSFISTASTFGIKMDLRRAFNAGWYAAIEAMKSGKLK